MISGKFKSICELLIAKNKCPLCSKKLKIRVDSISDNDFIKFINFKLTKDNLSFEIKTNNHKPSKIKSSIDYDHNKISFHVKNPTYLSNIFFKSDPYIFLYCSKRDCNEYYSSSSILKQKKKFIFSQFKIEYECFTYKNYWIQYEPKEDLMKIYSRTFPDKNPIIIPKLSLNDKEKLFNKINLVLTFS